MKKIGNTNLQAAPLAFGGNVFGWTIDEAMSFRLLDAFVDRGFNMIDTADVYSAWVPGSTGGESEKIIGKWLKKSGKRDKVLLATKVGMEMPGKGKGLSRKHIKASIEESLVRLQTDTVDLYWSHQEGADIPIKETLNAYSELIKQGKVRMIGASNYSPESLIRALDTSARLNLPRYEALQPHYNLYERESFEKSLQGICIEHNLGVFSYFSLASGFLTGKYRSEKDFSKSQRGGGMNKFFNDRGFKILETLDEVASKYNSTPARVSLAWLMAQPSIVAPIASATNLEQLNDIMSAVELSLDESSLKKLSAIG